MNSPQEFELELGAELTRYRPRREVDILGDLGFSAAQYYGMVLFGASFGALIISSPLVFIAEKMGAVPPILKDPQWGPITISCYVISFLAIIWFTCLLPRRAYLAIHEDGFVVQGLFRRNVIRFRDIVTCEAFNSTASLTVLLADRTQLTWKGFYRAFPPVAVEQLLNLIETRKSGTLQIKEIDTGFKRQIRRVGLAAGFVLVSLVVLTPVSDPKCREVLRKAFGANFCGLPSELSVPLLFALLFGPLVFVCPHLMIVVGRHRGLLQFLTVYNDVEARRSLKIVIAGGIYLAALIAAWIAYWTACGL